MTDSLTFYLRIKFAGTEAIQRVIPLPTILPILRSSFGSCLALYLMESYLSFLQLLLFTCIFVSLSSIVFYVGTPFDFFSFLPI